MKELTWKCHACGDERPDHLISVHKKKSKLAGCEIEQNIRYCNDRPECLAKAKEMDFLSKLKER